MEPRSALATRRRLAPGSALEMTGRQRLKMTARQFLISCVYCHHSVALVPRIGDAELLSLHAHLSTCRRDMVRSQSLGMEETLKHFRVTPADPDTEPPESS